MLYAHTRTDPRTKMNLPESEWQTLEQHLQAVADIAAAFAADFGAERIARQMGLLHDIGKATTAFQARLRGEAHGVDHKSAGAKACVDAYGHQLGRLFAYGIAGHHGGLPDDLPGDSCATSLSELLQRPAQPLLSDLPPFPPLDDIYATFPKLQQAQAPFYFPMLVRMLFSCLVDADYLDTERAMQPEKAARRGGFPALDALQPAFDAELDTLLRFPTDHPVNAARREVLDACLHAAEGPTGLYTLTVPTGGGKTKSSLAFAMRHARRHGMRRIIYAIPFTSITEQTADVYRQIFGDRAVLEHHSNVVLFDEDEDKTLRLAAENWDAPLIVTTNVQLLESLFAAKPTRARKNHRLARSVIVFDEAQTMPDALLRPTLSALESLCAWFGATAVLCTATQPALDPSWFRVVPPTEIIPAPEQLYRKLARTEVVSDGRLDDDALADRLLAERRALCIVNTRAHARKLFQRLLDAAPKDAQDGLFHLSASMCPAHRSRCIDEIKRRLQDGQPCVVMSTQVIEAGVDIDFPCVYREIAGMDSIAQAAGRCNREGRKVDGPGIVHVFEPADGLPKAWFSRMAALGGEILKLHPCPLEPEAIRHFFEMRYHTGAPDALDVHHIDRSLSEGMRRMRCSFPFAQISRDYHIIEDNTTSIVIPYDETARGILADAERHGFGATQLRALQRYTVSVYAPELAALEDRGYLRDVLRERGDLRKARDRLYLLDVSDAQFPDVYVEALGLCATAPLAELIQ